MTDPKIHYHGKSESENTPHDPDMRVSLSVKHLKASYTFGLRVARAIHLKLSDFDLERNALLIKGAKEKKDQFIMLSKDFLTDLNIYINYPKLAG
ncbi:MAG: hypothetical protein HQK83_11580 [Fibrobacteria bacterium]|nr:hypothetical protein [Fibrobacteria bacterium]